MTKKATRVLSFVLMLVSTIWSVSCASSPVDSVPALENRTLRISRDLPGFEYQYTICVKQVLFICTQTQMKKETYDLRDEVVRLQLINMGFVVRVREKP
jgi:hypothetical protein